LFAGRAYGPQPRLYLDTSAPQWGNILLSAEQNGNNISYTLSVLDSINANIPGKCSGLGDYKVSLETVEGGNQFTIDSGRFDGSCQGTVSGSGSFEGDFQGDAKVCVEVSDVFNNKEIKCTEIDVDSQGPMISSLAAVTLAGNPLRNSINVDGGNV